MNNTLYLEFLKIKLRSLWVGPQINLDDDHDPVAFKYSTAKVENFFYVNYAFQGDMFHLLFLVNNHLQSFKSFTFQILQLKIL